MSKNTNNLVAALIIEEILDYEEKKRKKKNNIKKMWVKPWLQKRQKYAAVVLLKDLEDNSPDDFRNYLRMDCSTYEGLLIKITPLIKKEDTILRDSISPHERLSATLRFLATGRSYADLRFSTYIGKSTLSGIVEETCKALIKVLKEYIAIPKNEKEWDEVANDFYEMWNFPNCIGAIDGKHVNITKPVGSGAYYFNYKKTYSIVLMAVVNAKYEFTMVEAGANGRVSDGGVYSNTNFCRYLEESRLQIPAPRKITNFDKELPYVFVADDAFPLNEHFMKPYSHHGLTEDQTNFNYRLSRARRVVENTFGIMSSRFRILLTTIHLNPEKTTNIVLAICYLHNFLRKSNPSSYIRNSDIDTGSIQPNSLVGLQAGKCHNFTSNAKEIRNNFL